MVTPDPVMLAYVRAPARPGIRPLALDDLPIVDEPCPADRVARRWPLALVASQSDELAGGHLGAALGDVVCDSCGAVLAQRITWSAGPAVIGLVRGRRWSRARSWGRLPASAIVAARQRDQWFCLLDRPTTPAHLPLACRDHGPMSVPSAQVMTASESAPLRVAPPG